MNRPMRILLVEDDSVMAMATAALLTRKAPWVSVTCVDTLAGGMSALANEKFDAVILDLILPCVVALEGLKIMRAAHPDMPIVTYTAGTEFGPSEVVEAGANGYVEKTARELPERLLIEVQNVVELFDLRRQVKASYGQIKQDLDRSSEKLAHAEALTKSGRQAVATVRRSHPATDTEIDVEQERVNEVCKKCGVTPEIARLAIEAQQKRKST